MFRVGVKLAAAVTAAAAIIGAGAGVGFHRLAAQENPTAPAADEMTVLMTREWSPDGKVPTGTIWRGFQTWQTDVARTEKGDRVRVDPMTSRAGRSPKGELVRIAPNIPAYVADKFDKLEVYPATEVHGSEFPPTGWQATDFDDHTWAREPYPQRELYGLVALRCLRGKFEVSDPGKVSGLSLTVRFRGGVAAYLNGKEIGRACLPPGPIKPDTLAEDYPKEAYVRPDGTLIEQGVFFQGTMDAETMKAVRIDCGLLIWRGAWRWHSVSVDDAAPGNFCAGDQEIADRYKSRCRKLEVKVPTGLLRKGVNVLALEIHRAPAWDGMFASPSYSEGRKSLISVKSAETWWDRSELEDVKLSAIAEEGAVTPNVRPPKGVRVWNHPACVDLDPSYYPDPNESLQPIRLRGMKNGTYSGQIVVSSTDTINGLNVRVTDLKGAGAGTIPASAIQVAYPSIASRYDTLESSAPPEIPKTSWSMGRTFPPVQPVWLTVRVPPDARAGKYLATVTVNVEGEKPVATSLELEVVGDWVLPDPKTFTPYVCFLECPDAVARRYNVTLWSEEHWRLLDKVFEVLGQLGTKDVFIPLVAKTHLGNPYSMVRWVGQPDGSWKLDTTIAERYLDLAVKHLGKVPLVCLYVATRSQYGHQKTVNQPLVTEMDAATGELEELKPPMYGTPESQAFWKPVIDRMREILTRRGLENSMVFGYFGDGPPREVFFDFKAVSPQTKWLATTHYLPQQWRLDTLRAADMLAGESWMHGTLLNVGWMCENDGEPSCGWRDRNAGLLMLVGSRSRSPTLFGDHYANVTRWRIAPESVLLSRQAGFTFQGFGPWDADFWANEWKTFDNYANVGLSECTIASLVGAGETGPVPTCRTRMLQEGLQEAEARIFVQNALLDEDRKAKLGEDLARRCKELCDARTRAFSYLSRFRYGDGVECMPRLRVIPDVAAWEDAAVRLYRLADEVRKALGGV